MFFPGEKIPKSNMVVYKMNVFETSSAKDINRQSIQKALPGFGAKLADNVKKRYQLYLMILLPVVYIIIFKYYPMYGLQIAFKKFTAAKGILGSPWVGFENISKFMSSYMFWTLLKNTLGISLYHLVAGFPVPIFLALALNATRSNRFRKTVQMVTYLPYFISTVVMVGILMQFISPRVGVLGHFASVYGFKAVDIMGIPKYFTSLYVWSGVWQHAGYSSIIYIAALSAIDQSLHEAAVVDGASRFQRILHIDIPGILPTAATLFILQAGRIMNVGFEKIFLMQNPLNMMVSEVISTYTYRIGFFGVSDFSYATAIGLFNSVINFILILLVNKLSEKLADVSLW